MTAAKLPVVVARHNHARNRSVRTRISTHSTRRVRNLAETARGAPHWCAKRPASLPDAFRGAARRRAGAGLCRRARHARAGRRGRGPLCRGTRRGAAQGRRQRALSRPVRLQSSAVGHGCVRCAWYATCCVYICRLLEREGVREGKAAGGAGLPPPQRGRSALTIFTRWHSCAAASHHRDLHLQSAWALESLCGAPTACAERVRAAGSDAGRQARLHCGPASLAGSVSLPASAPRARFQQRGRAALLAGRCGSSWTRGQEEPIACISSPGTVGNPFFEWMDKTKF